MRNMWMLLRHDIGRLSHNVMAIIVVFGLIMIPALFTWFNVIASWDPFSSTKNLTVAVANTDEGYQSDLVPLRINIGEQVLSALRANDDLDWAITSKDDAIDGTRSGEYYAALVLPPDFSADMMTFYTGGSERTEIEYYTNEKKNALSPKITDQGASEVSTNINEVFASTLGEAGMSIITSLSDHLDDADMQVALSRLEGHVGQVATQLRSGADTADMFTALLASSRPLVTSAADLASSSNEALGDASDALQSGAGAAGSFASTIRNATDALGDALASSAESYRSFAGSIDDVYEAMGVQSGGVTDTLDSMASRVQTQLDQYTALRDRFVDEVGPLIPDDASDAFDLVVSRFDAVIARQQALHDRLADASTNVSDTNADAQESHQQLLDAVAEAEDALDGARDAYENSLKPKLDELTSTLSAIRSDVATVGRDVSAASSALAGGSQSVLTRLTAAEKTTSSLSGSLTDAADRFDRLSSALETAADTGDLSDLADVIGSNPQVLATALSQPVKLDRVPVFEVASFGSAMAPLYTVLALWVGALLLSVALRVDVPREGVPGTGRIGLTQSYLGRYGIFGLIGLAQSSLVALGLIAFVQVEPAHPWLLMLAAWVTSLVFTLITYTFVVAFGNAGKALSVLLLVIQISSSGGAYPLQLLPEWFQNVSPFMPATHAVSAMRSAMAGVYQGDYWMSLGWLALFIVPTLLLGLVLRRPLIGFNQNLLRHLESTKLM